MMDRGDDTMGFQDDWMLRQIESIAQFVARVVFQKSEVHYEIENSEMYTHLDKLYLTLEHLIEEGLLGEAEDMLFDQIEYTDKFTQLATDFYTRLNALSNEELAAGNFSRDEVYDGYIEILAMLGIPIEQFKL